MRTRTLHKALSMLLTAAMVLNMGLTPVFAEGVPLGASGLTDCHTEHDEDCGYTETTTIGGCTHTHNTDCGFTEGIAEQPCTFIADEDAEASPSDATEHKHDESCGYAPAIEGALCEHKHDDTCGGYGETTTITPCTHTCEVCKAVDSGKQPEKDCTCEPADSGEQIHGKDCPLYTAPQQSEAVKALIAMVDALPNVADITEENKEATMPAFEAAAEAYGALSDEDKAAFEATEQYTKLMALHGVLYPIALMINEATWDISTGDLTLTNTCGESCGGHTVTGTTTTNKILVQSGTHNITLNDVSIEFSDGSGFVDGTCAFVVESSSTVNLTLEGTNVLKSGLNRAGLQVESGNTLTISGDGNLTATGGGYGAGIGGGGWEVGGSITITGGAITATGNGGGAGIGGGYSGVGGTITIEGGTVTATGGGGGAGIGGGGYGAGGTITIEGGTVTATGSEGGAGIGGGHSEAGGTITFTGNAVVFAGGTNANHIGAGSNGSGGTVDRTGGIIFEGTAGKLYGTNVTLTTNFTIPSNHTLTITDGATLTIPEGATLTNNGNILNSGSIVGADNITGKPPVVLNPTTHDIGTGDLTLTNTCGESCGGHTATGTTTTNKITAQSGTHNVTLNGVSIDVSAKSDVCAFEIQSGATVNLTLTGDNTLKSGWDKAGLQVPTGATLVITEESTGSLTATGGTSGAGIGGSNGAGGSITIEGGTVTATGGNNGAGIGGGNNGAGGSITISGDAVVYTNKGSASANYIGAGVNGTPGTVNKTGGIIFEGITGNVYGNVTLRKNLTIEDTQILIVRSGITLTTNGFTLQNNGNIYNSGTINGVVSGTQAIVVEGTEHLIGAADLVLNNTCGASCTHTVVGTTTTNKITVQSGTHNVTLNGLRIQLSANNTCAFEIQSGATVNLTLTDDNALKSGINKAGLQVQDGATLVITEASTGSLTATGGYGGAGIGGGDNGAGGNITINGGTVTANGGNNGAGIGGGNSGAGGNITIGGDAVVYTNKGSASANYIGAGAGGSAGTVNKTGGIIFEGTEGNVYGNVTLKKNLTIEYTQILFVRSGITLTTNGFTLRNNGNIYNLGTINGEVSGTQAIVVKETDHLISAADLVLNNTCGANCTHTVVGTTTTNKILVQSGTHNVTLNGLRIQLSADNTCAFEIQSGATVNLTLTGDNVLKSGHLKAGLQASDGATLLITEASSGSLAANGGTSSAGIGGGNITMEGGRVTADAYNSIGINVKSITINGGTVTANGSAAVGSVSPGINADSITIRGGTVIASGSDYGGTGVVPGIQGGNITIGGNAVVFSKGKNTSAHIWADTLNRTGGIIFEGDSGKVYGTSVTPDSFTIPGGYALSIETGKTVTIGSGVTLTNNGSINNNASIVNNGTISSSGTLSGTGAISGSGSVKTVLAADMISLSQNSYAYNGSAITPAVTVANTPWTGSAAFTQGTDYTVAYTNNTNVGTATVTVTPTGASLTGSAVDKTFTITQGTPAIGITTDKTGNAVTYGDSITFTANVSMPTTRGRAAAVNTVDFYYDGTKLNSSTINLTESGGSGTASFTYNTADKKIPAGAQTITAEYGGSGNLNGQTGTVNVTLSPKPLVGTVAGYGKNYDGSVYFTDVHVEVESSTIVGDDITAKADGTVADPNVGVSKNFTPTSVTLSGNDKDFYSLALTDITGTVRIERIDPVITVTTEKAGELGGRDIVVTVKITNPTGATTGFPSASEIAITPTNATLKGSITGANGVYTATYTLADYSAGAKASFKATVPSATTNYNANTIGTTSGEVEILDKYLPTVELTADKQSVTYGKTVTLTATVDKDGKTSPLDGKVQLKMGGSNLGGADPIDAQGKAIITISQPYNPDVYSYTVEFIPADGSDYKGNTSSACTVKVNKADMTGAVTITGTAKFGETLTANTSALVGVGVDSLETFTYQWKRAGSAIGSETSNTYTVTTADLEKAITVTVTPGNANYSAKTSAAVTPSKAASTVTITGDPAKTYDGLAAANPTTNQTGSTGAVTFEWYKGATKLSSAPTDAGSYSVKAILAETATHVGAESAAKEFVIEKAPLTIQSYTAEDKNYDGTDKATVSAVAFDGLQNSESLALTTDYTVLAKFAKADAGASIAVTGTVTLVNSATAKNYKLASGVLSGQSAEIKAINPTYSVANQNIKIAKTLTAIQAATTATGVNSQAVAGTLTWSETSGGSALTSYTFAGSAGETKTLYWTFTPSSGNYKALSGSTVFTLTEKEVPVLTVSNMEKTYDGEAVTTVTSGTAKVGETTVAGTFAFEGAPTMKDANTYTVTVKFTPTDTVNYETATTSITVTIKKAELTVKADDVDIVAGAQMPVYTATTTGLVNSETISGVTFTDNANDTNTTGTFTIIPAGGTISDGGNGNYDITYVSGTLTISSKPSDGGSTGDSSNSGGSYTPPLTSTETELAPPTQGVAKVTPKVDEDGNATLTVSGKDVENAIKKANNEAKKNGTEKNEISVVIEVNTNKVLNSVTTTLTTEVLKQLIDTKVNNLTIKSSNGAITFDLAALTHLYTTAGATVTVSSTKVNSNKLSAEAQKATGGRPVYDFKVAGGDKNITTFGGGKISIGIPYELQKVDGNGKPNATGTFENPGNLVGVYVGANGKLTYLAGTSYHAASKTMLINTTHLSMYGVAYKASTPTFTDTANHWAKDDIQFVAARGLLTGTTATTFSPNSSMTRAMFVTALGRLANADVSSYKTSSFNDVAAGSYYLGYVEWAAKNNIVKGVGDGKFAPDQSISRQEMAVMLQSYAKAIGYKLPSVHAEIAFTDKASIGAWAQTAVKEMQMAGILMGKDGGKFDPTGTATRAEVSAMLRRFVELVANSETAEGWVRNDSGNWMYFENGKAVTGKKKIDGTTYEFDQYGVTAILPKDRRYTLYTVQSGDSFWAIASKHKVNIFELASLNGKTIFSILYAGDELKVPQN